MTRRSHVDSQSARTATGQLTRDSIVIASAEQVSTLLGDETVILHMAEGMYYGLENVGTSIWDLLQQPRTVREICEHIVQAYDVEKERCEKELLALLQDLVDHGLIDVAATERSPE